MSSTEEKMAKLSKENTVEKLVPPKEELVSMTDEQLEALKKTIVEETAAKLMMDPDYRDKLRLQLERDSAIRRVEHRDQFADPALKVMQSGSLGPIDHQEAVAKPYKTDPSKTYRFINKDNEALYQLRRYQGYEPIKDDSGNEVRYMDGVLAQMPKAQYDETIGAQTKARKMLKKQAAADAKENFKEMGRRLGIETEGHVSVDVQKE
jgi:hypothetical protein